MTFQEASDRLDEIANGEHHAIQYCLKTYHTGQRESECQLYIHDRGLHSGKTWDAAFASLENSVEAIPEVVA